MKKHEYKTIAVILIVFVLFSIFQSSQQKYYDVLKVISPSEIIIDKNKNGVADDNETITVINNYQYIKKYRGELDDKLHLDNYTHYAFYYLTEKLANEILLDKKIVLKKNNIFINGENYRNILEKSGYLFKNNLPINKEAYKKRLKQIEKADYRLYNAKSNKYHLLECEYGQLAHNYALVTKSQLPKGATGCKYCINKSHKHKYTHKHKKNYQPNTTFSAAGIKLIVADHTTHLIPNRNGNSKICKEIIQQINNAHSTIDIAIYGYDRVPKIEKAIKNAMARGVKVRLVHDIDSSNKNIYANTNYFAKLINNSNCDKAPTYIKDKKKYTNSIMHNKFYIFDNQIVITGSANLSHTDLSDYNTNCILVMYSDKIASIYKKEFEQMYNGRFHNLKEKIYNKDNIKVGNSTISVYFSPKDNTINTGIIPLINTAKKYIYIPTFLITEKNITNALVNAHKRGVDIKIIVDATNAKNTASKHNILRKNGIKIKTENYAGKLHSKTILIDDKYCILGSMNLSKSGNNKNDENILIINNSAITKFYKKLFIYLWNKIPNYWLTHDVSAESIYSIGSCIDGIDNDYDGKTDKEDEGCKAKLKQNKIK